ncbi:ATP-grasp domain-containing protein [Streptomyces zingiberis]|uniref:ATP-grasp domain-containing protein n=1 Tax=Streptomyces zingiberis TaxID=2053010 RepID=A0ABX1C241_9ACTN|nr:ATP-grasp domain-containing protein [Streptomyces zingiberis]NJQ01674.1 ATP-grasp domain-containing protein [Streptomyces zingiberis]
MSPVKNIFVIGMDESNLDTLRAVPHAGEYRFHPLLTIEELQIGDIPIADLIDKAQRELDAFDGSVDAVVGYWDFPVSTLVPLLAERYGLRSTNLESIVKCEHKYWSRLEQRKVIEEHPKFAVLDPFAEDVRPPSGLEFPMWLKPVKSFSSELAFGVDNEKEFHDAMAEIREGISRVGKPFEYILDQLDLPAEVAEAGGQAVLAEETLTGEQFACEGYVHNGEVTVYGVLDSVNYPDSSSFLRHQYPSQLLPRHVCERIKDVSTRVMRQIGMDSATFSIEYFYDKETDRLNLLEINPRHSQSHAEMFEYVDGVPNHHCMLSLALGRDPRLPDAAGPYEVAAKWYHRRFEDGVARRVPTREEVERVEAEIPGVKIEIVPRQGDRLSAMPGQDSYSFELAHLFIGADSERELREKYDRCVAALPFEFDAAPDGELH